MILVIGEILFDLFPKSKRLGGAPFNFAYHLKKLDFPVRFISRIGTDDNGLEILDRIREAGFDPNDIQLDDVHPTGTVQVHLDKKGAPTFEIIPNVAYDFIEYFPEIHTDLLDTSKLLYFGTLAQRVDHGYKQIQRFLNQKQPNCKSFYDINLRPNCYSSKVIEASLQNADILKLNADELRECKRIIGIGQDDSSFIRYMMAKYSLQAVAVTQGDKEELLYTSEGLNRATPKPVEYLVDTVGAGDAFAAILVVGLLKKWAPQKMLVLATDFASRICTIKGAIPESMDFYEPIRKEM